MNKIMHIICISIVFSSALVADKGWNDFSPEEKHNMTLKAQTELETQLAPLRSTRLNALNTLIASNQELIAKIQQRNELMRACVQDINRVAPAYLSKQQQDDSIKQYALYAGGLTQLITFYQKLCDNVKVAMTFPDKALTIKDAIFADSRLLLSPKPASLRGAPSEEITPQQQAQVDAIIQATSTNMVAAGNASKSFYGQYYNYALNLINASEAFSNKITYTFKFFPKELDPSVFASSRSEVAYNNYQYAFAMILNHATEMMQALIIPDAGFYALEWSADMKNTVDSYFSPQSLLKFKVGK